MAALFLVYQDLQVSMYTQREGSPGWVSSLSSPCLTLAWKVYSSDSASSVWLMLLVLEMLCVTFPRDTEP